MTSLAYLGEVRALGEETVARMNRVGAGDLGRGNDIGNIQVAVDASCGTDTNLFVRKANVQRVSIGVRVDGYGADAQLLTGGEYPERNLASVGDQDLLEHEHMLLGRRGSDSGTAA